MYPKKGPKDKSPEPKSKKSSSYGKGGTKPPRNQSSQSLDLKK